MRINRSPPLLEFLPIAIALIGTAAGAADIRRAAAAGDWVDVTNNVGGEKWGAYGVTYLKAVPGSDEVIAGVSERGLWKTGDGGLTWKKLGGGEIKCRPGCIVFDPQNPAAFWVSGCYGDAPFKTDDGGKTFHRLGKLSHADGVAVDFTDPERKTLLLGLHEQSQSLQLSTDGGQSWTRIGDKLPGDSNHSTDPIVIDTKTFPDQHGRLETQGVPRHLSQRRRRANVEAGLRSRPRRRAAHRLRRRHLLAAALGRRAAQEHRQRPDLDRHLPRNQNQPDRTPRPPPRRACRQPDPRLRGRRPQMDQTRRRRPLQALRHRLQRKGQMLLCVATGRQPETSDAVDRSAECGVRRE